MMTNTTLSAAVSASADQITVASATGIAAGRILMIDFEFMIVRDSYVAGSTTVPVIRGMLPGIVGPHASGAPVFEGTAAEFIAHDMHGYESSTPSELLKINMNNGKMFANVGGYWIGSDHPKSRRLCFDAFGSGAPTDGTSGTGATICGPGSTYADYTNGIVHINDGTLASPVWTPVAVQATA